MARHLIVVGGGIGAALDVVPNLPNAAFVIILVLRVRLHGEQLRVEHRCARSGVRSVRKKRAERKEAVVLAQSRF